MVKSTVRELIIKAGVSVIDKTLLILLSNQYSNDSDIDSAITTYSNAIAPEGWETVVHKLSPSVTTFVAVDEIIEEIDPYATLIIGEDTPMALRSETGGQEAPSLIPYYTKGLEDGYTIWNTGVIIQHWVPMDIPTFMVLPSHNDTYVTKKNQIINTLLKFASKRSFGEYGDRVLVMQDTADDFPSMDINTIRPIGDVIYYPDPSSTEVNSSLDGKYKSIVVGGHANPQYAMPGAAFRNTTHAANVDTPFLFILGCFTEGWYCKPCTAGVIDKPYGSWFGHSIIDNPDLCLYISGWMYFFEDVGIDLSQGKSIAEALKGKTVTGDAYTLFGDPTFHY